MSASIRQQLDAIAAAYEYKEAELKRLRNERDVAVRERTLAREQVYEANDEIERLLGLIKEARQYVADGAYQAALLADIDAALSKDQEKVP